MAGTNKNDKKSKKWKKTKTTTNEDRQKIERDDQKCGAQCQKCVA